MLQLWSADGATTIMCLLYRMFYWFQSCLDCFLC